MPNETNLELIASPLPENSGDKSSNRGTDESPLVIHIEQARSNPALSELTECQRRVLVELLTGANEARIAEKLRISTEAVHKHTKNIYACLNVTSRAMLIKKLRESQQ